MKTFVVSDVFGNTLALAKLCTKIGSAVEIVDPYSKQFMNFNNEGEAYQYFVDNIGIEHYAQLLFKKLIAEKSPIKVIAFSVGSSALWTLSENPALRHVKQATCFYGSQIRNFKNITPHFPITLIYPIMTSLSLSCFYEPW